VVVCLLLNEATTNLTCCTLLFDGSIFLSRCCCLVYLRLEACTPLFSVACMHVEKVKRCCCHSVQDRQCVSLLGVRSTADGCRRSGWGPLHVQVCAVPLQHGHTSLGQEQLQPRQLLCGHILLLMHEADRMKLLHVVS